MCEKPVSLREVDSCPEIKGKEQFASHTFGDTSDLVGSEDPESHRLPPKLRQDDGAVMIALARGVAERVLSSALNIIAARTMVQVSDTSLACFTPSPISCPDEFWKYGIELQGLGRMDSADCFCSQVILGGPPCEKPDLIVYGFPKRDWVRHEMFLEENGAGLDQCC